MATIKRFLLWIARLSAEAAVRMTLGPLPFSPLEVT